MCDVTIQDRDSALTYNLSRSVTVYKTKRCSRREVVQLLCTEQSQLHPMGLGFCTAHARLARAGLVDENGNMATRSDVQTVRRYPRKFPAGLYPRWRTY